MTKTPGILWTLIMPLICIAVISTGQILFKIASGLIDPRRPFADAKGVSILVVALVLYGAATLVWIGILRVAPISRIYPLMALSFVLVPLAGMVFLKEQVNLLYWAGVALIIAGVALTGRALAN